MFLKVSKEAIARLFPLVAALLFNNMFLKVSKEAIARLFPLVAALLFNNTQARPSQ